jgi:1-acyl-sn-glycerol-3-phosphate acyltransferase
MFHLVTELGVPCVDWIEEFGAFPFFRHIGGLPFPAGDSGARATTVKRTIRLMREQGRSLVLFAEGALHRPPDLLPLGKSLETVVRSVPSVMVVPVAIVYDMSLHERPEAYLRLGGPIGHGPGLLERTREALAAALEQVRADIQSGTPFETLVSGTKDVNERLDMRRNGRG